MYIHQYDADSLDLIDSRTLSVNIRKHLSDENTQMYQTRSPDEGEKTQKKNSYVFIYWTMNQLSQLLLEVQ